MHTRTELSFSSSSFVLYTGTESKAILLCVDNMLQEQQVPTKAQCWTRDAYFRVAINFSNAVAHRIVDHAQQLDAASLKMEQELAEERRGFVSHHTRVTNRMRSKYLEDEEKLRTERVQLFHAQFPLSSLSEEGEGFLRLQLRSRLLQCLTEKESDPAGGAFIVASSTPVSQTKPIAPVLQSSHDQELKNLHTLEFEALATERCDKQQQDFFQRRLNYFLELCGQHPSAKEALEQEICQIRSDQSRFLTISSSRRADLQKRVSACKRKLAASVKVKPAHLTSSSHVSPSVVFDTPPLPVATQQLEPSNVPPPASSSTHSSPLVGRNWRQWEELPLEENETLSNTVKEYMWPSHVEKRVLHSIVCRTEQCHKGPVYRRSRVAWDSEGIPAITTAERQHFPQLGSGAVLVVHGEGNFAASAVTIK